MHKFNVMQEYNVLYECLSRQVVICKNVTSRLVSSILFFIFIWKFIIYNFIDSSHSHLTQHLRTTIGKWGVATSCIQNEDIKCTVGHTRNIWWRQQSAFMVWHRNYTGCPKSTNTTRYIFNGLNINFKLPPNLWLHVFCMGNEYVFPNFKRGY